MGWGRKLGGVGGGRGERRKEKGERRKGEVRSGGESREEGVSE